MNTPIRDFVEKYIASEAVRAHMPGHKGKTLLGCEQADITEIAGADSLYEASGIIKESEANASKLFGCESFYSAEGSSLCIRAMLYLLKRQGVTRLIASRNAHKSFISGCALLDFSPIWLKASEYLSCGIDNCELFELLLQSNEKTAVFITTPDYLGGCADIKAISALCKASGAYLCVDCAHGAYLKFLPESLYPTNLGADMCCSSAHKTLPVLTGGAYLHIASTAPKAFCENAKSALSLFGSTSPSYLILQSLDTANAYIANGYPERLSEFIIKVNIAKGRLKDHGFVLCGSEPLKLTLKPKSYGYCGGELAKLLENAGIFPEFADSDYLVLMLTPENADSLDKIITALLSAERRQAIKDSAPDLCDCPYAISLREALFAESEIIKASQSLGRILAQFNIACPPAVPIAVCGERINEQALKCFEYYGIKEISVVKE